MMWLSVLPIGRLAGMWPLIASVCRNRRPLALSASWRASGIPSAMGVFAWLTMSSRNRLAWRALRAISEMPLLLLSSSSSVMIGRNTSCSSKRNRLVGSRISTLVSRTKSFVTDCRDSLRGRREGTDLREAPAGGAEATCRSDGFNKIEHLLGMTGNLDPAPFAPENAVAVEHEGAALDAPYLFPVQVLHLHHAELFANLFVFVRQQLEGKPHLGLEILVRLEAVARDSGYRTSRLLELRVEIAELRPFVGAARRVVLRVEIEDEQLGFDRREPEFLAAGGGQDEVAYRFVGHPESAPLWAPLSPEFGSERNRLHFRGSSRKKFYELPRQFRRRLLRDVMTAIQGPSLDGFGPLGPVGEGREAARYRSVLAPENEERRDHLAADVGLVVREIDRLGRAVILAARVNRRRIAKASPVLRKRLGREGLEARVAGPHVALDVEIRIGADQGLRNRLGPKQEEPVVIGLGELAGDPGIHRARGNDVEHGELRHRGGVVESHAMRDPSAAVVTDDEERFMTQGAHRLDLVLGHGALGIVGMVGKPVGFFAVSVTAQIGGDHLEPLRELGRDAVPDRVGLRIAVQKEQGRAHAAVDEIDRRAARPDAPALEAGEELAVHERNSLPCSASNPDRPATLPNAISLRGRLLRSSDSASARIDTRS